MLGFIGTGTINSAMVRGLGGDALVSPRGAKVAAELASALPGVRIAESNQAVVDGSDTVVLAIRPQVAEEVIRALRFREGQSVISLVAATSLPTLAEWIGPGVTITRAVPLPFVAERSGVTPVYPPEPAVLALFDRLGTAIPCASAEEFDLLAVASALMGSYFGILETAQGWLAAQGMPEPAARTYLAGLFASLGRVATQGDFAALRGEYSTKGGLNEQMFAVFADQGGTGALRAALSSVLARVRG